jgi:hypothetical protein
MTRPMTTTTTRTARSSRSVRSERLVSGRKADDLPGDMCDREFVTFEALQEVRSARPARVRTAPILYSTSITMRHTPPTRLVRAASRGSRRRCATSPPAPTMRRRLARPVPVPGRSPAVSAWTSARTLRRRSVDTCAVLQVFSTRSSSACAQVGCKRCLQQAVGRSRSCPVCRRTCKCVLPKRGRRGARGLKRPHSLADLHPVYLSGTAPSDLFLTSA